jgi:hypothetical protein
VSESSDYQVFGLRVRSDIPLPELFPATGDGVADVTISRGSVGAPTAEAGIQVDGNALILTVPAVAQYRIEQGSRILVDGEADVPERNLRLYLLGSAFGALLHQRGMLPLHANAVEIDGKAIAFMGESGSGKSTLAAWFHDRGFPVIADDVCVVRFDKDGRAFACPGLPRLRLWEEVLTATGRQASEFPRSYLGDDEFRKYDVSISANAAKHACAIGAVFILTKGDQFAVEQLRGVDAANAVFDNTYRGTYVDQIDGHHNHWMAVIELVRKVPIYWLSRLWDIDSLDEQCTRILESVRGNVGT